MYPALSVWIMLFHKKCVEKTASDMVSALECPALARFASSTFNGLNVKLRAGLVKDSRAFDSTRQKTTRQKVTLLLHEGRQQR